MLLLGLTSANPFAKERLLKKCTEWCGFLGFYYYLCHVYQGFISLDSRNKDYNSDFAFCT